MSHSNTEIVVLSICILLFFFCLGSMPLLDPDEGRHAEIAREMLVGGNWLTLSFNDEPYYEKPAGFYWLVASAFAVLGKNEWSARLPSAAAALGGVVLTFVAAATAYGLRTAWIAALVLSTSAMYLVTARMVLPDMVFSTVLSAALLYFFLWIRRADRRFPAVPYVLVGAATIIKGPVALILVGGALALYAATTRDRTLVRDLRLAIGLGIVLSVALPWYMASAFADPEYVTTFLWRNNVGRFLGAGRVGKPEPFLYYLYMLPAACLPWSLLWPAAIVAARRTRATWQRPDLFLACWSFVVVGFFSLSRSKLPTYALPALPAISLLFARAISLGGADRERFAGATIWAVLLLVGPPIAVFFLPAEYRDARAAILSATAAALPALLAVRFSADRRRSVAWISASVATLGLVFSLGAAPVLARYRSFGAPARLIAAALPPDGRLITYQFQSNTLRFYSGRTVERVESMAAAGRLLSGDQPVVAALRTWDIQFIPRQIGRRVYIWWRDEVSHRMLVSNLEPRGFAGNGWVEPLSRE